MNSVGWSGHIAGTAVPSQSMIAVCTGVSPTTLGVIWVIEYLPDVLRTVDIEEHRRSVVLVGLSGKPALGVTRERLAEPLQLCFACGERPVRHAQRDVGV